MRSNGFVKIVSIALALISIGISVVFWGLISGFEMGYFYGVFQDPPGNGFFVHGPNFYQSVNVWYFTITIGFSIFVVGKLIRSLAASTVVCLLSLSVSLYPFWDMLRFKSEILGITYPFPYRHWVNVSIGFDWFVLFAALFLMFVQVYILIRSKSEVEGIAFE